MGEQAATEAYEVLIAWLRSNHLGWVADQVEDEVKLGKTKPERISVGTEMVITQQSDMLRLPPRTRQTSAEFVGRVDYTAQEKFDLATGAVEAVVVGGIKIQDALLTALQIDGAEAEIHFVPGETGEISHSYRPTDLDHRRAAIDEIDRLLGELREDVKGAD